MGVVSGKWAWLKFFRARFARITVLEPPSLKSWIHPCYGCGSMLNSSISQVAPQRAVIHVEIYHMVARSYSIASFGQFVTITYGFHTLKLLEAPCI